MTYKLIKYTFIGIVTFTLIILIPNLGLAIIPPVKTVEDTIPKPWTNVIVTENFNEIKVACWGREYHFNNNILPSQIYSLEKEVLKDEVKFEILEGTQKVKTSDSNIKVLTANNKEVVIAGSSKILNLDNTYINTEIRIEYDGLMLIDLFINSEENWSPDFMSIIIPYKNDFVKYFLKWPESGKDLSYYGKLPEGKGLLQQNKYIPYIWMGSDETGLFWFCEGTKNWPNYNKKNAIEYVRTGDVLTQRLNLGKTNKFSFGLQATPVKPLPDNWREYRITDNPSKKNIRIKWIKPGRENSIKFHSWPQAENDDVYKDLVENTQKDGHLFYAYTATTRVDENLEVFKRNKNNWEVSHIQSKNVEGGVNLSYIHPASEGYADSLSTAFASYMKKYNLDGYYLDGGDLFKYWTDSRGNRFFPILAYRELQRKLYEAVKKTNPEALIITHMSTQMDIPVLAYSDAYVDGEQFRTKNDGIVHYKVNDSYLDVISLEQFRTEFMGKQWGLIPFFLPEFSVNDQKLEQPTLGLATLLLLHDVQLWAGNSNKKVWEELYEYLDEFGFTSKGVEFFSYYADTPIATSKQEDVLVSAYQKGAETLLIIVNLSKKKRKGKIKLNKSYFKGRGIKSVTSMVNKVNKTTIFNRISYDLEPLSYDLIWIKE